MLTPKSRLLARFGAPALLAFQPAMAVTFTWNNTTGTWSAPARWAGGASPSGANPTDELIFGGTLAPNLSPAAYTATNDLPSGAVLNRLTFTATDPLAGGLPGVAHILAGNSIRPSGVAPQFATSGSGAVAVNIPVHLDGDLLLTGNGAGVITFNRGFSGFADLTKSGTGTFRFGTFPFAPALTAPSENSWMGALRLEGGTVRFNNNADSGRTALRANSVTFPAGAATLTCANELRTGAISGAVGLVESAVAGANTDSEDIVIFAIESGSFGGTIRLAPPTGTGNDVGKFVVRGPGVQTVTGTLDVDKDLEIAGNFTMAATASLGARAKGAVAIAGGTLRLDNTATNNNDRLRNGSLTSTGVDTPGGGLLQLIGHTGGTSETVSRIQLGAQTGSTTLKTKARAGEMRLQVVHRAGAGAATVLTVQEYERDATTEQPLGTVEISAIDGTGTTLALGNAGNNPRVGLNAFPVMSNSLPDNQTGTLGSGWAVVKVPGGLAFATHGANGFAPAATTTTWTSDANANALLAGDQAIGATAFHFHTLRLAPTAAQTLSIAAGGSLNLKGIVHSGAFDTTLSGGGSLGGTTPRYLHVDQATLTLDAATGNTAPLVKAGAGTLVLTNTANSATTQITAINRGTLRAPLAALPGGELRFRGGVLEISGGGTFQRPLVNGTGISGPGTVNWNTIELTGVVPAPAKTASDRGGGGFAAFGADATVDLAAPGPDFISWEQRGFLQSGYPLILGSPTATAKVTLVDFFNLTSTDTIINYAAREIRVDDNPATTADRAVLTGDIAGTLYNDLLKTGPGTLELSGACPLNGAIIIQAGTLVITGSATATIGTRVLPGATLAGAGTLSTILLENGGLISPGDASTATLTASGLVWKAGGTIRSELGGDLLTLGTGTLTRRGTGTFTFDFAATGAAGQTYTLATFGSTSFDPGDFTATDLAPGITGTFAITGGNTLVFITDGTPIQQWRQLHFGTTADAGNAADLADPDADGLANRIEFALGTNPLAASPAPAAGTASARMTLTFPRSATATGITLTIQAATALTGPWNDLATSTAPGVWASQPGVTANEPSGIATITDSVTIGTDATRFLRLKVTLP